MCRRWIERTRAPLARRGFGFAPQQEPWVQTRLGLRDGRILDEMKVQTATGELLGGADAVLHLATFIWWARPLNLLARMPGGRALLRRLYNYFAKKRGCDAGQCRLPEKTP
jgi:hypothetical protein